MDFHDQTISAGSNCGEGEWRNQIRQSAGVTRIDYHRQMRFALENGNGSDVQRIPSRCLEGAHTALAQNHVSSAVDHDVLRGHQQLFYGS